NSQQPSLNGVQAFNGNPQQPSLNGVQAFNGNSQQPSLNGVQAFNSNPQPPSLNGVQAFNGNPQPPSLNGVQAFNGNPQPPSLNGVQALSTAISPWNLRLLNNIQSNQNNNEPKTKQFDGTQSQAVEWMENFDYLVTSIGWNEDKRKSKLGTFMIGAARDCFNGQRNYHRDNWNYRSNRNYQDYREPNNGQRNNMAAIVQSDETEDNIQEAIKIVTVPKLRLVEVGDLSGAQIDGYTDPDNLLDTFIDYGCARAKLPDQTRTLETIRVSTLLKASIKRWRVMEQNDMIYVWHHTSDAEPDHCLPDLSKKYNIPNLTVLSNYTYKLYTSSQTISKHLVNLNGTEDNPMVVFIELYNFNCKTTTMHLEQRACTPAYAESHIKYIGIPEVTPAMLIVSGISLAPERMLFTTRFLGTPTLWNQIALSELVDHNVYQMVRRIKADNEGMSRPFSSHDYVYDVFANILASIVFSEKLDSDQAELKMLKYVTSDFLPDLDFCDIHIAAKHEAIADDKRTAPYFTDDNLPVVLIELIIAYYPNYQDKLRTEISREIGDRVPVVEDKCRLNYTMAFISEMLRHRNPTPIGIFHKTMVNTKLGLNY
ncbi:unnamed protein product, partial [Medioppia subpectinata]